MWRVGFPQCAYVKYRNTIVYNLLQCKWSERKVGTTTTALIIFLWNKHGLGISNTDFYPDPKWSQKTCVYYVTMTIKCSFIWNKAQKDCNDILTLQLCHHLSTKSGKPQFSELYTCFAWWFFGLYSCGRGRLGRLSWRKKELINLSWEAVLWERRFTSLHNIECSRFMGRISSPLCMWKNWQSAVKSVNSQHSCLKIPF